MAQDWTKLEVELIVSDYFGMLIEELNGVQVNKSFHRKAIQKLINSRSEGSIEFKHQNISAVLVEFGLPFIKGYKPRFNYQNILVETVRNYITNNLSLESLFQAFAEGTSIQKNKFVDFDNWIDTPPTSSNVAEPRIRYFRPVKVNYLEQEQKNRKLGLFGEELIMEFEKTQLIKAGKESQAEKIEWVSKEKGDGLGFDILSRNIDGTDKYIEVKTTKLSKETPIFFTKNEYLFSIDHSSNFYLYRIFNFADNPKMFNVKGSYDSFCRVEAVKYRGHF